MFSIKIAEFTLVDSLCSIDEVFEISCNLIWILSFVIGSSSLSIVKVGILNNFIPTSPTLYILNSFPTKFCLKGLLKPVILLPLPKVLPALIILDSILLNLSLIVFHNDIKLLISLLFEKTWLFVILIWLRTLSI